MVLLTYLSIPIGPPFVQAIITQPDPMHKLPSNKAVHTLLLHPESSPARGVTKEPDTPVAAAISADALGAAAMESPDWDLGQLGGPDTTCYIIYTSGSTGKPKVGAWQLPRHLHRQGSSHTCFWPWLVDVEVLHASRLCVLYVLHVCHREW